ncbi:Pyrroline-5-carboxylate reductase 1, mitochondrial [Hypsibius exemplaris]|uniref:Pyrroline-5-carboxylate reductase n=1 Tax=Hypsibius exemplaris TaxID=2072580 RepID=A0A1W0X437_HYPEX|nr:Pyrroline-5-carboxylate reductase 1, mitochondrial [Hypsibius exemplaris]
MDSSPPLSPAVVAAPLAHTVGFIGAGKMATAMANGFIRSGLFQASKISAGCPNDWDSSELTALGVAIHTENESVALASDILILAVKPDVVATVLQELSHVLQKRQTLVFSVAAGITIAAMERSSPNVRYIRVMPNTPALIPGYGATVFCPNSQCSPEDARLAEKMFTCLGFCAQIPENLMDAVTGLSGSGPAYIFTIIEALSDGGVKMGLPRDLSTKLAAQTVLGAAKMVTASGQHPGVLRDNVASPGGTTIHGLHALEQGGLRNALINAVEAATKRSAEMGKK